MSAFEVAGRWFERAAMGDGITLLWEPHVHPFVRCNIWHVRGRDRDLVVDMGMGIASLRDELRDLAGREVLAVTTHAHFDHVGSWHEFDRRLAHGSEPTGIGGALAGPRVLVVADHPESLRRLLTEDGEEPTHLVSAIPAADFDVEAFEITYAEPTSTVTDGDVLDLGDRTFEVLHLPGHSPGSIGLWDASSATLFSGDAIYDGQLLDEVAGADIGAYVATMRRLRELPVEVVHGGHDPSFGRGRFVEIIDAYLARRAA